MFGTVLRSKTSSSRVQYKGIQTQQKNILQNVLATYNLNMSEYCHVDFLKYY